MRWGVNSINSNLLVYRMYKPVNDSRTQSYCSNSERWRICLQIKKWSSKNCSMPFC